MRKKKKKKGFTLVELIVVVAIVAVLAAIAIPTFNGIARKSKVNAILADGKTIESETKIAIAKIESGEYSYSLPVLGQIDLLDENSGLSKEILVSTGIPKSKYSAVQITLNQTKNNQIKDIVLTTDGISVSYADKGIKN